MAVDGDQHAVSAPSALTKKSRPTVFIAAPRHGCDVGPVGPVAGTGATAASRLPARAATAIR